jgi:hypothetical protein
MVQAHGPSTWSKHMVQAHGPSIRIDSNLYITDCYLALSALGSSPPHHVSVGSQPPGGAAADFRPVVVLSTAANGQSDTQVRGVQGGTRSIAGAGIDDDVEVRIEVSLPLALAILANVKICAKPRGGQRQSAAAAFVDRLPGARAHCFVR